MIRALCLELAERAASPRGRALCVGRRVVPWAPRRPCRARGLARRSRRVARRAASPRRSGARAGDAVRTVVRAGDGQPGLRPGPRAPGLAAAHRARPGAWRPGTSTCSTWGMRRHTRTSLGRMSALAAPSTGSPSSSGTTIVPFSAPEHSADGRPWRAPADRGPLYRLMAELKDRHAGLEIESCCGGGGRLDLGILERSDRVWVSDCIDAHERHRIVRWTGLHAASRAARHACRCRESRLMRLGERGADE